MFTVSCVSLLFFIIGLTRWSIMSMSFCGSLRTLIWGVFVVSVSFLASGVLNARMGLKIFCASFISVLFLAVTIFGMDGFWAISPLNPSSIMMSVLFGMLCVMSFSVSFVVFVFCIVVSSFCATAIVVCAPALVCFHVSRPFVSMVKSFWCMCLAVAMLYPFLVSPLTIASVVVVFPECLLPTTAITGVAGNDVIVHFTPFVLGFVLCVCGLG